MKRLFIYVALAVVFAIAVVLKIGIIKERESAEIVSILGEWQRDGVPVEAFEVTRQDLVRTEKLTGEVKSQRRIEAMVSSSLARSLARGRQVSLPGANGLLQGTVADVTRAGGATGLFRVVISLRAPLEAAAGSMVAVDVEVSRIPGVLVVPTTAIKTENGKNYVWRLTDGAATRSEVQVGARSAGLVQVRQGLQEGDLVVARGQSNLQEDLGVQTISTL